MSVVKSGFSSGIRKSTFINLYVKRSRKNFRVNNKDPKEIFIEFALPLNTWYPLKGHTYLNKLAALSMYNLLVKHQALNS